MRYLTKSRFKMALQCPTKLFYTKKLNEYADNKIEDPFLKALAKGGFQVGELAKCYYPDGVEIEGLDYEKTWEETKKYLEQENVILFEPAIKFKNLFVRVDILIKHKTTVELIEVKSKSFNAKTFKEDIWLKRTPNKLDGDWYEYLYDIAFQSYVTQCAFPEWEVKSALMCADKDKETSIDGLNQKFLILNNDHKAQIKKIGDCSPKALGAEILSAVDVTDVVFKIINDVEETEVYRDENKEYGFKEAVELFSKAYVEDKKIKPSVSKECKKCEFRTNDPVLKSGFKECWKECQGMNDEELNSSFSFDVWNFKKFNIEKPLIDDLDESDIGIKERDDVREGLSMTERQWLQVLKYKERNNDEYIDKDGISTEFGKHNFPLHFIDFETSMVAIPFGKGKRPYEQIAFQFSHHVMEKDGSYRHAGEWINAIPGKFPNFDFVRALKKELENDYGTIFRYSNHENTVLSQIKVQLQNSNEADRAKLIEWINTVTHKKAKKKGDEEWCGDRDMVDLCEIIKKFYYHPKTKGSNSIKYVLPAILNAQGKPDNPYKDLPPVFNNYDRETLDLLYGDEELANGGAAMTAYAYMQFGEMSDVEREKIQAALLRYCKLDTEAMVWVYQYLRSMSEK